MQTYKIPLECNTVFDMLAYTVEAMKDACLTKDDIENYITDSLNGNDLHLLEVTEDTLEECNSIANNYKIKDSYEDVWVNNYCNSFWDEEDYFDKEENMYDDYWVVNNALNGQDDFDDVEAYEGFSSCGSHYWDSANGLMSVKD